MFIPETCPEWLKIKIFESREMREHSKEDETGQQNHTQEDVAKMAKEEFGIKDDDEPVF